MIKKILIIIISSLLLLGLSIGVGYALAPQIFNPLPITSDFYDIDSKGVVQGFAPQFLAAADTKEHAESYVKQRAKKTANVLDLHSQKITGTQYAFSYFKDSNENINNIFAMFIKIDLSDTWWQWEKSDDEVYVDYYTGYYTFAGTDLSTIKQLNLTNAHFTSVADGTNVYEIFTAYNTFSDTNLSGLITLNLNNATFSPTMNMNVEDMESLYINTGCSTFMGADLSRLEILDLSHTLFIETTQYTAGVQHIYTGWDTFYGCQFENLIQLKMNETCFASQNLESRSITTAYEFFRSASFPLLENLDLSTVIFVSSNIAESNCLTARRTFRDVNLPRLINLNLDNCAFWVSDASKGSMFSAFQTFESAILSIERLDLSNTIFGDSNMSSEQTPGMMTFAGCEFDNLFWLNLDNIKIRGTDGEETNVVTIVLMGGFSTPIWTPTSPVQIYGSSDLNNWSEIFDRWFDEECWQYYQSYSSF